jgi:lipopolysaccharide/colanic/teichoic acid biosynthesis glycosyltransferase
MSLVGPRPVIPEETVRYGPHLPTVLRVRPGVTGVWQVSGRNDIAYDDRVEMDSAYAMHHVLGTNLAVLLKTVVVVVWPRGNGAY